MPIALTTLEELQRQIAELTVRHTKDVADLANRNKDLELEVLRERDTRREAVYNCATLLGERDLQP